MKKLDDASIGNELPGLRKYCDTPPKFFLFFSFPPMMCVVRKNPKTMLLLVVLFLHGVFDKNMDGWSSRWRRRPAWIHTRSQRPIFSSTFLGVERERTRRTGELAGLDGYFWNWIYGPVFRCVCSRRRNFSLSPHPPFFSSYLLLYFRTSKTFNTSLSFFLFALPTVGLFILKENFWE